MALAPGTRLGPYEVKTPIGSGGMGEVYRSRDTRLDRDVAIKVLSGETLTPEFRDRFEREACTISRLSHPNVCTLHDVGQAPAADGSGDIQFLVMELLEGETLAARLRRGALPVSEVCSIGAQIAEGLAAAHAHGIAHRDLKPGNIMLTPRGVKLLDFGLAKVHEPGGLEGSMAATIDASLTATGVLIGTVPYMAPEQVEGRPAGPPADIFAFGCVLYEMASGRRPFLGDSPATLMASILSSDPPSLGLVRPVPPQLERLVRGCLVKDPERRWRSAADLAMQLRALADTDAVAASGATAVPADRGSRSRIAWAIAALAMAVAVAAVFWPRARSETAKPVRFSVMPPPGHTLYQWVEGNTIAVSPDGSRIAFIAADSSNARQLWLRALDEEDASIVPGTNGVSSIMWSPDGRELAFFTGLSLKRVALDGGVPVTICEVPSGAGSAGSWGRGGDIVYSTVQGETIHRVPAAGGTPERLLEPDEEEGVQWRWPSYLPDGRSFLCHMSRLDRADSIVVVEPGRGHRGIIAAESRAEYAEPGRLLYVRDGTLMAHRFDLRTLRASGTPVAVADRISYFLSNGAATFHTSEDGTLAFAHPGAPGRLVWIDRSGRETGTLGAPANYHDLAFSRDGTRLLASIATEATGTYDIWSIDPVRGDATRITRDRDTDVYAIWEPGERRIVYSANRGRAPWLHRHDLATGESRLMRAAGFAIPGSITPDGRTLLFSERDENDWSIWTIPLEGSAEATPWLDTPADEGVPRLSPDGRYVAFTSNETGASELYLAPYPGPGERRRISTGGAGRGVWNMPRGEILYMSPRGIVSVPVATTPQLRIGTPTLLAAPDPAERWWTFAVEPSGDRLLVVSSDRGDRTTIEVLVHWPEAVAR